MAIFTETVEIDVDIEDFDIDEIIEYLEEEGFTVIQADPVPEVDDWFEMNHAIWEYKYGSVKEAVKIIERCFPELNGLSEKFV